MNAPLDERLDTYLKTADTWQVDQESAQRRTLRMAWSVAVVLGVIALAEAFALIALTPLKRVEPYTLLVGKQTGYVEALKPIESRMIAPDAALTRSLVAQYVLTREGFDIGSLQQDYRKVALWSSGAARDRYIASMQATDPRSPLALLPHGALVTVEIRGISSLSNGTALVRFATARADLGAQQSPQLWQAVVTYRFSTRAMSVDERLINPLGFEVTRYRRNAEFTPEPATAITSQPIGPSVGTALESLPRYPVPTTGKATAPARTTRENPQ